MNKFNKKISNQEYEKLMSGEHIYGDDFDFQDINDWFEDEKNASIACYEDADPNQYDYLNYFHCYKNIESLKFDKCLAIGPAYGAELKFLSKNIKEFIAIEPEKKWWSNNINGTPVDYMMPKINGDISLKDGSVDLIICFSVLHHIPNVSHIIDECHRVLKPNGTIIIREPVVAMGDWRFSRRGMTARERGVPLSPLLKKINSLNFKIKNLRIYDFPATRKLAKFFRVSSYFNKPFFVALDYFLSNIINWKVIYNPKNIFQKIQPSGIYIHLIKNND